MLLYFDHIILHTISRKCIIISPFWLPRVTSLILVWLIPDNLTHPWKTLKSSALCAKQALCSGLQWYLFTETSATNDMIFSSVNFQMRALVPSKLTFPYSCAWSLCQFFGTTLRSWNPWGPDLHFKTTYTSKIVVYIIMALDIIYLILFHQVHLVSFTQR